MKIEKIDINQIIPYKKNPRKNSNAIDIVATSIKEYGIKQPIVIDKNNVIVVGHTRYEACKKLGIDKIPVLKAEDLSDSQIKGYRIMDNKSSDFSEWDDVLLNQEILELEEQGFDLSLTGFTDFVTDDGFGEDFSLPSGDKAPFQQMTFTLSDEQAEVIKLVLERVKELEEFKVYHNSSNNENSNGNAISFVISKWEGLKK